jgi:hypothetical protein
LTPPKIYGIIIIIEIRKAVLGMAHKKKNRKERPLWTPYYVRKTKTFKEHKENLEKKHKKRLDYDE